jgi:methylglutaconyl-CoA hydratase
MTSFVRSDLQDGIGTIVFFSEKANSLTSGMLQELQGAVESLSTNSACKVLLISSDGRTFCAGAALDELKAISTVEQATEFFLLFGRLSASLVMSPKAVIVRAHGKAVGGGVGLVAAGDIAVGLKGKTAFMLSEFQVGIAPLAISPVLELKIGRQRTMELSLLSEWQDSDWGRQAGLLTEVVEGVEVLDRRVTQLAQKLVGYPVELVGDFKKAVYGTIDISEITRRAAQNAQALLTANARQ